MTEIVASPVPTPASSPPPPICWRRARKQIVSHIVRVAGVALRNLAARNTVRIVQFIESALPSPRWRRPPSRRRLRLNHDGRARNESNLTIPQESGFIWTGPLFLAWHPYGNRFRDRENKLKQHGRIAGARLRMLGRTRLWQRQALCLWTPCIGTGEGSHGAMADSHTDAAA